MTVITNPKKNFTIKIEVYTIEINLYFYLLPPVVLIDVILHSSKSLGHC